MKFPYSCVVLAFAGLLSACGDREAAVRKAVPSPTPLAQDTFGRNLIVNGDAETTQSSDKPGETPAAWSRTNDVVAMEYGGMPDEWQTTKVGCPDGRRRYFRLALAINEETKSIAQTVQLAGLEADIDKGSVQCAMGGWFGGWAGGDASARLEADFLDGKGQKLGTVASEAPDPAALPKPEFGRAAMVKAVAEGPVPAGARRIEIRLTAVRPTKKVDTIAVATADNLSLVLKKKD